MAGKIRDASVIAQELKGAREAAQAANSVVSRLEKEHRQASEEEERTRYDREMAEHIARLAREETKLVGYEIAGTRRGETVPTFRIITKDGYTYELSVIDKPYRCTFPWCQGGCGVVHK